MVSASGADGVEGFCSAFLDIICSSTSSALKERKQLYNGQTTQQYKPASGKSSNKAYTNETVKINLFLYRIRNIKLSVKQ